MALDFVKLVDDLKAHTFNVTVHPKQLGKFHTSVTLNWKKEKFDKKNRSNIPKKRGIYAFIAAGEALNMPPHGVVMYVGITGDVSQHNLNARFGNYLIERRTNKRAHIYYLLQQWSTCLYFYYAVVSDKRVSLAKLERDLNDCLMPPFSKRDFSAVIRKAKRAF